MTLSRTLLTGFRLPDIHILCPIDDFVTKEIHMLIGL